MGGGAGLRGEALAEFGSGVVPRNHEQIVEGGNTATVTGGAETLVESVKQIRGGRAILPEQAAGCIRRKAIGEGAQEAMRTIAEEIAGFRMGARQAKQNFA